MSYIKVKNVYKRYTMGDTTIVANNNINFEIEKGEFVVVLGPSGAGKSTMLNILGGMDRADEGSITIDKKNIAKYNEKRLTQYRREDVGFVFQFYNLIPNLTALENIDLAAEIVDNPLNPKEVLKGVGLENRMNNFPAQLSGGEQQRVAIARALVKNPKLLLCDEPTGALDYETGREVLKLLHETSKKTKMTVLVITHNSALAPIADKVIEFKNSKINKITTNKNPLTIDKVEW